MAEMMGTYHTCGGTTGCAACWAKSNNALSDLSTRLRIAEEALTQIANAYVYESRDTGRVIVEDNRDIAREALAKIKNGDE